MGRQNALPLINPINPIKNSNVINPTGSAEGLRPSLETQFWAVFSYHHVVDPMEPPIKTEDAKQHVGPHDVEKCPIFLNLDEAKSTRRIKINQCGYEKIEPSSDLFLPHTLAVACRPVLTDV